MQSKFLKIALAWIGAFFCMWLFGNHMLDASFIPPPFFFFVALLYTAVTFAKDKEDFRGNKISVFESIFVKLSCLIYAPLILWGYKYLGNRENERAEKILRRLSTVTYLFFILPFFFALYPDHVNGIIEHWDVRFYQGVLVGIIFYFLAKFALYQWYDGLLIEMTTDPTANYMAIFFGIYFFIVSFFMVIIHALD